MGNILRRKRDSSAELEEITNNLKKYEQQANEWTEKRQRALYFMAWSLFVVATIATAYTWIQTEDSRAKIGICSGIFFAAILLFVLLRIVLHAFYNYLIRLKRSKIQLLSDRKAQIIEDVKENEKFKIAKEILEKYGSEEDLEFLHKEKKTEDNPVKDEKPVSEENPELEKKPQDVQPNSTVPKPSQSPRSGGNAVVPVMTPLRSSQFPPHGQTPMRQGGGPVRPFINPNRTPLDKLVDYIIGDGPNNRYALVCANCSTHNGMALPEEFDYMAYFCYKCNFFNPSKRMRRMSIGIGAPGRPSLPPMHHGIQNFMQVQKINSRSNVNLTEVDTEDTGDNTDVEKEQTLQDRKTPVESNILKKEVDEKIEEDEQNGTPSDPIPHVENEEAVGGKEN